MKRTGMRVLMAAIATAAVVVGVLLAVSGPAEHRSSRGDSPREGEIALADINAAARYLGLAPTKLRLELRQGRTLAAIAAASRHSVEGLAGVLADAKAARIRTAVKAGKLSATSGQAQLASVSARARGEVRRHRPALVGLGGALTPAARYLGMSRGELLHKLRAGQTLAAITAHRKGRTLNGLIDALVAARSARITAAVRLRALNGAEAAELRATLRRRMSALAQRRSARVN